MFAQVVVLDARLIVEDVPQVNRETRVCVVLVVMVEELVVVDRASVLVARAVMTVLLACCVLPVSSLAHSWRRRAHDPH